MPAPPECARERAPATAAVDPAESLARLVAEARACRICRDGPNAPLPQEPNPVFRVSTTARLCVASQAPGTRAHRSSTPFNDASGARLRAWMGVTPEAFYDAARVAILPMGFCFPGQDAKGADLPPRRECAFAWRARFFAHLPNLELILCVGRPAQAWHLGADYRGSLTATVRDWRRIFALPRRPRILPLPHASWRNGHWLKQNPWFEAELVPFLQVEVRRIMDPGPEPSGRAPDRRRA